MNNISIQEVRNKIQERIKWTKSEKEALMKDYNNHGAKMKTMIEALNLAYGMNISFLEEIKKMIV